MRAEDWISVKERLPEPKNGWTHSDRVLLWYEGSEHNVNQYGIGYYHFEPPFMSPGFVDFYYAFNGRKPTHWMPLPLPPKELITNNLVCSELSIKETV